jgi:hypothetical protein
LRSFASRALLSSWCFQVAFISPPMFAPACGERHVTRNWMLGDGVAL